MAHSLLVDQLAAKIADLIRAENMAGGTRLVERALAERLRVSRSPIRSALRLLAADGVVEAAENGGYIVAKSGESVSPRAIPMSSEEDAYYRIAKDRLEGVLPEKITEKALARDYNLTRVQIAKILRRITAEGWIERLPGHGWAFRPMLTSMQTYEDSYRFRLIIEPAAILEARFVLNKKKLQECRAQQQELIDGAIWTASKATLYDLNSQLHEAIIECSQNPFYIDALKRVDQFRRLFEYRQTLDRDDALNACREHIKLIDLLLAGKRREASAFMRRHLSSVSVLKTIDKAQRAIKRTEFTQDTRQSSAPSEIDVLRGAASEVT